MPIRHRIIPSLSPKLVERFWSRVAVAGESDCWIWQGTPDDSGYGKFSLPGSGRGRNHMYSAHRIAFSLAKCPPPPGVLVCHTCDTPSCVNPAHLFLGDQTVNMQDMLAKGRGRKARGEQQHLAKLTEVQVREIRARYRRGKGSGASAQQLGPEYGVTPELVLMIVARKIWKHVH